MKTQPNDSISPISAELMQKEYEGHYNNASARKPFGLTKREHFAAMAMQGLCSMDDKGTYSSLNDATNDLARTSVEIADALINALNK